MTIASPAFSPPPLQTTPVRGSYYAFPLRGRLTPYEGGTFAERGEAGASLSGAARERTGGFSFGALIDIINPLQHIPIVSSIYRRITGDELGPASRIAGGGLFFGVIGLAGAMVNAFLEKTTGQDVGDRVLSAALGKKKDGTSETAIATAPATEPEYRGQVRVIPQGKPEAEEHIPLVLPAPAYKTQVSRAGALDPATFDALARTLGGTEPIKHLAPGAGN
jgi:hypothetical protein